MAMITPERDLEESLVTKLRDLKYEYRPDIRDRAKLEANFREKFECFIRELLLTFSLSSTTCNSAWVSRGFSVIKHV